MENERIEHPFHVAKVGVDAVREIFGHFRRHFDAVGFHFIVDDRELGFEIRFLKVGRKSPFKP